MQPCGRRVIGVWGGGTEGDTTLTRLEEHPVKLSRVMGKNPKGITFEVEVLWW